MTLERLVEKSTRVIKSIEKYAEELEIKFKEELHKLKDFFIDRINKDLETFEKESHITQESLT